MATGGPGEPRAGREGSRQGHRGSRAPAAESALPIPVLSGCRVVSRRALCRPLAPPHGISGCLCALGPPRSPRCPHPVLMLRLLGPGVSGPVRLLEGSREPAPPPIVVSSAFSVAPRGLRAPCCKPALPQPRMGLVPQAPPVAGVAVLAPSPGAPTAAGGAVGATAGSPAGGLRSRPVCAAPSGVCRAGRVEIGAGHQQPVPQTLSLGCVDTAPGPLPILRDAPSRPLWSSVPSRLESGPGAFPRGALNVAWWLTWGDQGGRAAGLGARAVGVWGFSPGGSVPLGRDSPVSRPPRRHRESQPVGAEGRARCPGAGGGRGLPCSVAEPGASTSRSSVGLPWSPAPCPQPSTCHSPLPLLILTLLRSVVTSSVLVCLYHVCSFPGV